MVNNHIKRIAAPKTWKVSRKTTTFITKPFPGVHNQKLSISINTFLKDMTNTVKTTKEAKYLLTKQEVHINGKRIRDHKHAAGLLDVVSIPSINKSYRLIMDATGSLAAKEVKNEKEITTLLKISGKTMLTGSKMQLNTTSGRNIIVDEKIAKEYKKGDSVIVTLPNNKIKAHYQRQKGAPVFVFIGKHCGKSGTIEEIQANTVKIKTKKETFETYKEYILVTGKDKSELDMEN